MIRNPIDTDRFADGPAAFAAATGLSDDVRCEDRVGPRKDQLMLVRCATAG